MCGRYTLTYSDLESVVAELDALLDPAAAELYRPRYNVAPTNAVVIARALDRDPRPTLVPAIWGLRRDKRLVINARSENAASRFPAAYQGGRCVVPADGFYEWTGERDQRQPIWFHAAATLFMAGLLEEQGHGAPPLFAVLTTAARPPVSAIHDRMPVLFDREGARRWLLAEPPPVPLPDDVPLESRPVSTRVNGTAHDDPACLDPPDGRGKQLGLF